MRSLSFMMRPFVLVAAAGLVIQAGAANAEDKLPSTLAWTAYDVGSGGYNQAVAIGGALKRKMGVNLRVLPGKNDVSRQIPLREKKVQFSATGLGASYFAQEGVHEFGEKSWGPQEVRLLLTSNSDGGLSIGVANDLGIKTMADLKGKRVAWVHGSPSLNENIGAVLRFAGLTWDDVVKVEFSGFGPAWDGIIANQVDAAWASTTSGKAYQLETSPRGIFWPPLPHNDKAGWARMKEVAPFFVPIMGTEGAAMSKEKPWEGATYPYPILLAYADQDEGMVYAMTKAMVELFPEYKGSAPGIDGWALERQVFEWVVPWHAGAVRYFKEKGVWNDALQAHNDKLIERQKVLKAAWAEMQKKKVADSAFEKTWAETRRAALVGAGMSPVW